MSKQEIQWYAIQISPTVNRGRSTVVLGGDFEVYTDRAGRKRKRRVKGTGQREFVIETLLRKRGFSVFLPTKRVYRRKSKYTKEKRLVAYPLLVGWVFVGWPEDENRWPDLFACNLVRGVACDGGRPYRLTEEAMARMFKRWGGPDTRAPERERFMRTHHEFKAGDRAQIVEGPFDGMEVQVVDLDGPSARVVLELLGGERAIEIDAMSLKAA